MAHDELDFSDNEDCDSSRSLPRSSSFRTTNGSSTNKRTPASPSVLKDRRTAKRRMKFGSTLLTLKEDYSKDQCEVEQYQNHVRFSLESEQCSPSSLRTSLKRIKGRTTNGKVLPKRDTCDVESLLSVSSLDSSSCTTASHKKARTVFSRQHSPTTSKENLLPTVDDSSVDCAINKSTATVPSVNQTANKLLLEDPSKPKKRSLAIADETLQLNVSSTLSSSRPTYKDTSLPLNDSKALSTGSKKRSIKDYAANELKKKVSESAAAVVLGSYCPTESYHSDGQIFTRKFSVPVASTATKYLTKAESYKASIYAERALPSKALIRTSTMPSTHTGFYHKKTPASFGTPPSPTSSEGPISAAPSSSAASLTLFQQLVDKEEGRSVEVRSSSSLSSATTAIKKRRPRTIGKRKTACYGSQNLDDSSPSDASVLYSQPFPSTVSALKHRYIHSTSSSSGGGSSVVVGADAIAVQDAGSFRMMLDDTLYLCSTVLSSITNQKVGKHTSQTADAALDLAITMSMPKSRAALLSLGHCKRSERATRSISASAYASVLDVLGCVSNDVSYAARLPPSIVVPEEDMAADACDWISASSTHSTMKHASKKGNEEKSTASEEHVLRKPSAMEVDCDVAINSRTKSARRRRGSDTAAVLNEDVVHLPPIESAAAETSARYSSLPPPKNDYNTITDHALGILAHYISLDATNCSKQSASSTSRAAQSTRRMILRHKEAMCGIARLILADPLVMTILTNAAADEASNADVPDTVAIKSKTSNVNNNSIDDIDDEDDVSDFVESQDDSVVLLPLPPNQSSSAASSISERRKREGGTLEPAETVDVAGDPTKRGRKRKKRPQVLQRHNTDESCLDAIPEHEVDDTESVTSERTGIESIHRTQNLLYEKTMTDGKGGNFVNESGCKQNRAVGGLDFLSEDGSRLKAKMNMGGESSVASLGTIGSGSARFEIGAMARFGLKIEKALSRIVDSNGDDSASTDESGVASYLDCIYCSQLSLVKDDAQNAAFKHNNRHRHLARYTPGSLALGSMNRILAGKNVNEEDDSVDKGNDQEEPSSGSEIELDEADSIECGDVSGDAVESSNLSNPLIFKNVMLRRSGVLPYLAAALVDVLVALDYVTQLGNKGCESPSNGRNRLKCCTDCLVQLQRRMWTLASIIDGSCCLSDENRRILCCVGVDEQARQSKEGLLIPNLVRLATSVVIPPHFFDESHCTASTNTILADVALSVFRTLTSLTHENDVAGRQLVDFYDLRGQNFLRRHGIVRGIVVVFHLLRELTLTSERMGSEIKSSRETVASGHHLDKRQHHCYDAIIFCLNILANVLETSSSKITRRTFLELRLSENVDNGVLALTWLTRWVVSQTESFRDAVLKGTFEDKNSEGNLESSEPHIRDLEKREEEYLVMAGNGFILLACLMRQERRNAPDSGSRANDPLNEEALCIRIREIILSEMPKDEYGASTGMLIIINTLKAFCNFYYYSVGDLSVAVVEPVIALISELKEVS